jgi:hypothetical protein
MRAASPAWHEGSPTLALMAARPDTLAATRRTHLENAVRCRRSGATCGRRTLRLQAHRDAEREAIMSIANPEQSALGLPNSEPTVRASMTNAAKCGYQRVIAKILISAAIGLGWLVGGTAPAGADPNSFGTDPNPFSGFSCHCRETAPAGSPVLRDEIDRGIREGLSAWLPGLPAPTQPSQPRP